MTVRNIFAIFILMFSQISICFANDITWKEFFLEHRDNFTIDYRYSTNELIALGTGSNEMPAGTPVKIRLLNAVSSDDTVVGSAVDFKVDDDVTHKGITIIRQGTIGSAEVLSVDENQMLGQGGKLTIGNFEIKSVNGTTIPLKGIFSSKGEDKVGMAAGLGLIVCLPFLLIKGKEAVLDASISKTVYTAVDYNF